jgi:phosphohistidine swiveling domain-containing protein
VNFNWPVDSDPSKVWPIYTRGNVGEVYPNVVMPLEWEIARAASEAGWRAGAEQIGFLTPNDYGPEPLVMLGVFGGYAYFNASLMRLLGVRTPGLSVDLIDTQFLGDTDVAPYVRSKGDKNLRATAKVVGTVLKTLTAKKVPLLAEMRKTADEFVALAPPMDASTEDLWHFGLTEFRKPWEFLIASHVAITLQATIASGALTDLCEAKLGDPNLALALTTGIGEVTTALPVQAMFRLANETSEDNFDTEFAKFLEEWGHRGPNEFSVAGRDWAYYPEVALAAIESMRGLDASKSPKTQEANMLATRKRLVAEAKAKIGWQAKRLDWAINSTILWSRAREESKNEVIRVVQPTRHRTLEIMKRCHAKGGVPDTVGPLLLTTDEFEAYMADPPSMVATIEERRAIFTKLSGLEPPFAFDTSTTGNKPPPVSEWKERRAIGSEPAAAGSVLTGAAGAPGTAVGTARVIMDPSDPTALEPGDILVTAHTDPSWTPLFVAAGGVVVEVGAAMSHSMIVSRELGLPCVVGVEDATLKIPDGAQVEVNGQTGTVTIL